MHTAYTSGQALLQPAATSQTENLVWWGLVGLALWAVVGIVLLVDRPQLLRPVRVQNRGSAVATRVSATPTTG